MLRRESTRDASGEAAPMPGPPADPYSRKSLKVRPGWRQLPAGGRVGPVPKWPLSGRAPAVWAELWRTPQAAAWEDLRWTRGVAHYVNLMLAAEAPGAAVTLIGEERQRAQDLGLTPMGLKRLEWQIAAPVPAGLPANVTPMDDYRDLGVG